MAAFEVIALDTATPQLRAPGAADTYTFPRAVEMPLGTANGVLYLNGSKVVTSGSGLTFDGSLFTVKPANTEFVVGSSFAKIENKAGATASLIMADTTDSATIRNIGSSIAFVNSSSEQMRLTSTGLGIGTNNPAGKLDVISSQGISWGFAGDPALFGAGNVGALTGGSFVVRTPSANTTYQSGFGIDGSYVGGKSTINIKAFGVYSGGPYSSDLAFYTSDQTTLTERMRLDSSGNLGLGVTPSAWSGLGGKSFEVGLVGNYLAVGSANQLWVGTNSYYAGGWKYASTAAAAQYYQYAGAHQWYIAPSGTAGNAISFSQAMTLDASGNLLVGGTSVYAATVTSYGSASRSGGIGIRNSAGTAAGAICTYAAGSGGGSTDIIVESTGILYLNAGGSERARIPATGGMVVGTAALATNATDGFLYVPTCAGTPTGTPTTQTGTAPIVINTTNNKLYFYSGGAWRDAGP